MTRTEARAELFRIAQVIELMRATQQNREAPHNAAGKVVPSQAAIAQAKRDHPDLVKAAADE